MNHRRSARQVVSATRTLPTLPCRARYPRPQNWASTARFYRNSHNPISRVQRVIFHKPRLFMWRNLGRFALYAATAAVGFEYLSYGLDLLVETLTQVEDDEDDEYEDDEELDDDERFKASEEYEEEEDLDLEGSIYIFGFPFGAFLPMPWTRRQLPRKLYAPDDETVQRWNAFMTDKLSVQQLAQQTNEEIIAVASSKYRNDNVKVGRWVSDPRLPAAPPRDYDQLGIVLFDGFPRLERRPAPPITLCKDALQSFAIAAGASCSFMIKTKTNKVRQFLGWPPLIIKESEFFDLYNKMLQDLHKLQEQQARAASKKNAALEKAGDRNGEDSVVPARSPYHAGLKTVKWSVKHVFLNTFVRELNKRLAESSDIPRDCFAVVGTVSLQAKGGPRSYLHDFKGVYSMRQRRFVGFDIRLKEFKPM
ncbi:hypothetical protein IWX49DRAFT_339760 [Phyllosticta citricarpa]|uniref:Uncharacterized protein n=2 Tax=Phyllosticta TaxID=121621 RepID=A0ABR1MDN9_9PEZI